MSRATQAIRTALLLATITLASAETRTLPRELHASAQKTGEDRDLVTMQIQCMGYVNNQINIAAECPTLTQLEPKVRDLQEQKKSIYASNGWKSTYLLPDVQQALLREMDVLIEECNKLIAEKKKASGQFVGEAEAIRQSLQEQKDAEERRSRQPQEKRDSEEDLAAFRLKVQKQRDQERLAKEQEVAKKIAEEEKKIAKAKALAEKKTREHEKEIAAREAMRREMEKYHAEKIADILDPRDSYKAVMKEVYEGCLTIEEYKARLEKRRETQQRSRLPTQVDPKDSARSGSPYRFGSYSNDWAHKDTRGQGNCSAGQHSDCPGSYT